MTTTVTGCAGPAPDITVRIEKKNDANEDGRFSNNEEAKIDGQDVDFKLVITNTSNVAVQIMDLTDSFGQTTLDLLADECSTLDEMVLDPDESVTCTFTLEDYSPARERRSSTSPRSAWSWWAAPRRPAIRTPRGFAPRSSWVARSPRRRPNRRGRS